jgi:hypothetical protein
VSAVLVLVPFVLAMMNNKTLTKCQYS